MARLKITIPNNSIAEIQIPVRITDINYGNHVGNDSLVSLIHEARVQWLATGGFSELNLAGAAAIMSELQIEYKQQVFYGDNLLFQISIGDISAVHFEIFYRVLNQHQTEVAVAKTGIVCFDYTKNKVAQIPEAFTAFISNRN